MERGEISVHEVRLFLVLQKADSWMTSKQVAKDAEIAPRTARALLLKLSRLNIIDVAESFPGHRYKLSKMADKRNGAYLRRLQNMVEVFGLK